MLLCPLLEALDLLHSKKFFKELDLFFLFTTSPAKPCLFYNANFSLDLHGFFKVLYLTPYMLL